MGGLEFSCNEDSKLVPAVTTAAEQKGPAPDEFVQVMTNALRGTCAPSCLYVRVYPHARACVSFVVLSRFQLIERVRRDRRRFDPASSTTSSRR